MKCILLLVVCLSVGCSIPPPAGPLIVRPSDLAKAYRDSPHTASTAYGGIVIRCPASGCRANGNELTWSLGSDAASLPVVVFQFIGDAPPISADLWIQGVCRGRVDDGQSRELPGFTFHVVVEMCYVAK